ncbi:hypothetical protein HRM2_42560 [Desulforapulum autotrophicum HRM2]|jgi:hypothetical protein|uniref:Uncharacterized protein n=1 Tax=Desulforapulum autotrophicum (strain ATCC 43914 / DSM 3382 / VKM B-1955 / HRM2) TaxID=177437 RepID=C0QD80_DESAH|nr:hypothetical protein [Desulforapulum autotrophicum]ACN17312.1 hypothetical protein HRM2_42560 [Desulforapulum autotrophicum HRM2]
MDKTIVQQIALENGQKLTIKDLSRKISTDAYQVVMEANIDVDVVPGLFASQIMGNTPFESILKKVGTPARFKKRVERNFIMADEKEAVFQNLVDTFNTTLVSYLSKPDFPAKLVMKLFRE